MNALPFILLGAGYLLLKSRNSDALAQLQDQLEQVKKQAQKAQDDITATNKAIQDENYIREQEEIVRQEESDLARKCYPVGFYGVIGNYYTSDKLVSFQWYLRFKNTSNDAITVNLQSLSVTILNSKQVRDNTSFIRKSITVQPKSDTGWICVTKKENAESYGYSTVGADIQQMFPDHRYDYWYKAEATLKYTLSNSYVNNGLSVDVPAVVLEGGVYGVRVYEDLNISNFAPKLAPWADYHIQLEDYFDKKFEKEFGNMTVEEVQAKIDAGEFDYIKRLMKATKVDSSIPKEPELEGGVTKNYFWYGT